MKNKFLLFLSLACCMFLLSGFWAGNVFSQEIDCYYKTTSAGGWTETSTWEFSSDGSSWGPATDYPGNNTCTYTSVQILNDISMPATLTFIYKLIIGPDGALEKAIYPTLTLGGDLTVGWLDLHAGKVDAGAYTLTVSSPSTTAVTGGDEFSYVIGKLARAIIDEPGKAGHQDYHFPVGNNPYTPVVVNLIGTGTLTVSTTAADHPSLASSDLYEDWTVERYWSVDYVGTASITYDATFNWAPADEKPGFESDRTVLGKWDDTDWSYPEPISVGVNSVTVTGQTEFSDFQVGNLCIELDWIESVVDLYLPTDPNVCQITLLENDLIGLVTPNLTGEPFSLVFLHNTQNVPPNAGYTFSYTSGASNLYEVIATATNACTAASQSATFRIFVEDKEPPYLTGTLPGATGLACIDDYIDGTAYEADVASAFGDNCEPDPITATLTDTTTTGDNCGGWTITYTYEVSDAVGNVTTTYIVFSGQDTEAPVSTLIDELDMADIDECVLWADNFDQTTLYNYVLSYVTDNCTSTPTVTASDAVVTDDDCGWVIDMWFRVQDACGNAVTPTVAYSGANETPPGLVSPALTCSSLDLDEIDACKGAAEDFAVEVGALAHYTNVSELVTDVEALYVGECTDPVTATFTYMLDGDNCDWTLTFEFTIADACGVSTTCTVVFEGNDQTDPAFDAFPVDQNNAIGTDCQYQASWYNPSVLDNCDATPVLSRTYAFTETTNPSVSGTITGLTTSLTGVQTPGAHNIGLFEIGIHEFTYTGEDACGNLITQVFTITVFDDKAPVMANCSGNLVVENTTDECGRWMQPGISYPDGFPVPSFTEICSTPVVVTNNLDTDYLRNGAYYFFPVGVNTVTYVGTDQAGNSATCTFTITVEDTQAPELIDPLADCSTLDGPADPNICLTAAEAFDPTTLEGAVAALYEDNCGWVSATHTVTNRGSANTDCDWTFEYVFEIFDGATPPNSVTCTVVYSGGDTEAPALVGASDALDVDTWNACYSWAETFDPSSLYTDVEALFTDNCGTPSATFTTSTLTGDDCEWTLTMNYRVYDQCDNSSPFTVVYEGSDGDAPGLVSSTITCSSLDESGIDLCYAEAQAYDASYLEPLVAALYVDDCNTASATLTSSDVTGTNCSWEAVHNFTIFDDCGNETTCQVTYTGGSTTTPTFSLAPGALDLDLTCSSEVPTPNPADPMGVHGSLILSAISACGVNATVVWLDGDVFDPLTSTCDRYVLTRTYKATDECNNVSYYIQTITVFDNVSPTFTTVPDDETFACASLVPDADTDLLDADDNCGGTVSITHQGDVTIPGICADRYVVERTYRATDACGNYTDHVQTFTVHDDVAPVISPTFLADVDVKCYSDVPATDLDLVSALDNCGGQVTITVSVSEVPGACVNRLTVYHVYTAVDACGNESSVTQTINVYDDVAPSITTTLDAVVDLTCASEVPAASTDQLVISATDNCGGQVSITHNDVKTNETCVNRFTLTRTYTATDLCGNTDTFVQVFNVYDDVAPTMSPSLNASVTVTCSSNVPAANTAAMNATDNCGGTVDVTSNDVISDQTCTHKYVVTRTYTATDDCGNVETWVQTITVNDNVAPVFVSCPTNLTRNTNANVCTYTIVSGDNLTLAATDNCTGTVTIRYHLSGATTASNLTTLTGAVLNTGLTTVDATATDVCGNVETCTFTITVVPQRLEGVVAYHSNNYAIVPMSGQVKLIHTNGTDVLATANIAGNGAYSFATIPANVGYVEVSTAIPFSGLTAASAQAIRLRAGNNPPPHWTPDRFVLHVGNVNTAAGGAPLYGMSTGDAVRVMERLLLEGNSFTWNWAFFAPDKGVDGTPFNNTANNVARIAYNYDICVMDIWARVFGDAYGYYGAGARPTTKSSQAVQTGDVLQVIPGEAFEVPVVTEHNMELGSMTLYLDYASDKLEIVEVLSDLPEFMYRVDDGVILAAWTDDQPVVKLSGESLMTLVVKTKGVVRHNELLFNLNNGTLFTDGQVIEIEDVKLSVNSVDNTGSIVGIIDPDQGNGSLVAYPNPFRNEVMFNYTLAEPGTVKISIVNMLGAEVAEVVNNFHEAGRFEQTYTPESRMEHGIYFVRFTVQTENNTTSQVVRLVYMR